MALPTPASSLAVAVTIFGKDVAPAVDQAHAAGMVLSLDDSSVSPRAPTRRCNRRNTHHPISPRHIPRGTDRVEPFSFPAEAGSRLRTSQVITCHISIFKVSQSCSIMGCWPAYRTDQPRNRGCGRIPTPPFNAPRSSADREKFHGTAQVRRLERRQNG